MIRGNYETPRKDNRKLLGFYTNLLKPLENFLNKKFDLPKNLIDNFCTSQYHLQNKMKNLSLQITSPKFLDDSFTTQMDLLTGKVFYHSQLGEYLNMLPPIVSDAIEKAIWKYIFSQKVLAIPHPIHIDYYDDYTMKQDIQPYIDQNIRSYKSDTIFHPVANKAQLDAAQSIQPSDVMNAPTFKEREGEGAYGISTHDYQCQRVKERVEQSRSFPTSDDMSMRGDYDIAYTCSWFNKNGCMCGIGDTDRFDIPEELYSKYAPLDGKCGFQISHYYFHSERLKVRGCDRHLKEIRSLSQGNDENYVRKIERILDEYLEQHNYHYRYGCWVKGNPEDGYTWDKTRKNPKKVPHQKYNMSFYKRKPLELVCGKDASGFYGQWDEQQLRRNAQQSERLDKEVYHPKLSKRLENKIS